MSNKNLLNSSSYQNYLLKNNISTDTVITVDCNSQKMTLIDENGEKHLYDISTSEKGLGTEENSEKTPTGVHRIREKFGDNAPLGTIFKSRENSGEMWQGEESNEDLILTRILRLEGLEEGINRGGKVDSYNRYIYFHGTNREDLIGTPSSHGCIRMRNKDIIDLYDRVKEGTIVIIG